MEPWDRAGLWEILTEGRKNKKGHICRWAIVNERNRAEAEALAADGRFAEIVKGPDGKFDLIRLTKWFREQIRKSGRSIQDPQQRDEALSFVGLDEVLSLPESAPSERGPSVIMLGCRPWQSENGDPCDVCGGEDIAEGYYCARCDRDHTATRVHPSDLAKDREKRKLVIKAGKRISKGDTFASAATRLGVERKTLYRAMQETLGDNWRTILEDRQAWLRRRAIRSISA